MDAVLFWGVSCALALGVAYVGYLFARRPAAVAAMRLREVTQGREGLLLSCTLLALILLIILFPGFTPWEPFVNRMTAQGFEQLPFLTAAAALVALLLFAANHAKAIADKTADGERYLGENVPKFRALQNSLMRIINVPLFRAMVLILFGVPLVQPLVLKNWKTPVFWIVTDQLDLPFSRITAAVWCASFGIIGLVLLVNAISAIRYFTDSVIAPDQINHKIEAFLTRQAAQEVDRWFRSRTQDPQRRAHEWVIRQLQTARTLYGTEREVYFALVLYTAKYDELRKSRLTRCVELAAPLFLSGDRRSGRISWARYAVEVLTIRRRTKRIERDLLLLSSLRASRQIALTSHFHDIELTRDEIIEHAIQEMKEAELEVLEFTQARPDGTKPHPALAAAALRVLTTSPSHQKTLQELNRGLTEGSVPEGPAVGAFPIAMYRQLISRLITGPITEEHQQATDEELDVLSALALDLRDEVSRLEAVASFYTALAFRIAQQRGDLPSYPAYTLSKLLEDAVRGLPAVGPPLEPAQLREIASTAAFRSLIGTTDVPLAIQGILMGLTQKEQPLVLLLHRMASAASIGAELTFADLRPFQNALRPFTAAHATDRRELCAAAVLAAGTELPQQVSQAGVEWLLDVAERPFTLELCTEFLDRSEHGDLPIRTLSQFTQWYVLTASTEARNIPTPAVDVHDPQISEQTRGALLTAAPNVFAFRKEWRHYVGGDMISVRNVFRDFCDRKANRPG